MGGLRGQTTSAGAAATAMEPSTSDAPNYAETQSDSANPGGQAALDGVFEGSQWTREDAQTVLLALNTAILLAWAYTEMT